MLAVLHPWTAVCCISCNDLLLVHVFSFCMCTDHVPLPWTIITGQSLNILSQCKTVYNITLKFCTSLAPSKVCDNSAKIFCETRIKPCLLGSRKFSFLNWSDSVSEVLIKVEDTITFVKERKKTMGLDAGVDGCTAGLICWIPNISTYILIPPVQCH